MSRREEENCRSGFAMKETDITWRLIFCDKNMAKLTCTGWEVSSVCYRVSYATLLVARGLTFIANLKCIFKFILRA